MVIKPMIRNSICMNAHPVGCRVGVKEQIDFVRNRGKIEGPKRALILGCSGGYGLATRIVAAFGSGAKTLGVSFEREPTDKKTGTPGWYNNRAFEEFAAAEGLYAETLEADAFSPETKQQVIEKIKSDLDGSVDLVIYSLATGVRPKGDGTMWRSSLKPIGEPYHARAVDPQEGTLSHVTVEPADEEEIESTVKVMGGEDWQEWIEALKAAGVLAEGVRTVAYSYLGPDLTKPVYRDGTIGRAKDHLESTAKKLDKELKEIGGDAYVSINKAVVTRASAVIPVVPLYLALLFKVMKDKGLHEGCIEQIHRLFTDRLYADGEVPTDPQGRIRVDDWEMRDEVQGAVEAVWPTITEDNLERLTDLEGYRQEFLQVHGFGFPQVDYDQDVEP
jgi:enoyl-[acyl-carrier protein] reductase / trans-2-enoyl-CoA reductase (NAD+)